MSALIPNLFEKYGGASALKPTLVEFTKGLLVNPSIRRCLGDLSNEQIVEHNFAMFESPHGHTGAGSSHSFP